MSMLPCDEIFSKGISEIVDRLQNTEYAQKARTSFEEARTYSDHNQIIQTLRKLNNEIQTSDVEFVQRVSKDLQALLEQEAARTAEVSRKILSRKEEDITPEPMEEDTDQTPFVEETTIARKRKKEKTEEQEEPLAKRQKIETQTALAVETFPAEEVGMLPLDIIQKIAGNLSAAQKNLIFNTLLGSKDSLAARFREAIIRNDLQDMPAVDPEFAQLYRSTFGKSLALTQKTIQEWEAQLKTDKSVEIAALDYRLYSTMQRQKLLDLPNEFDALPEAVRNFFIKPDGSQIHSSEILNDQRLCKQVVKAIRTHNLVCLGDNTYDVDTPRLSAEGIRRGYDELATQIIKDQRGLTDLMIFSSYITHIPIEIEYFKNMSQLYCCCSTLTTLPPEIGKLTELERVIFSACTSLTSLPTAMEKLKKIDLLFIDRCPNLRLSREQAERFKGIRDFRCPRSALPPEMLPPYPPNWQIVEDDVTEQP